jgi:hypothetical protein
MTGFGGSGVIAFLVGANNKLAQKRANNKLDCVNAIHNLPDVAKRRVYDTSFIPFHSAPFHFIPFLNWSGAYPLSSAIEK